MRKSQWRSKAQHSETQRKTESDKTEGAETKREKEGDTDTHATVEREREDKRKDCCRTFRRSASRQLLRQGGCRTFRRGQICLPELFPDRVTACLRWAAFKPCSSATPLCRAELLWLMLGPAPGSRFRFVPTVGTRVFSGSRWNTFSSYFCWRTCAARSSSTWQCRALPRRGMILHIKCLRSVLWPHDGTAGALRFFLT